MKKGGGILPKPLLAAAMLALFVFALVFLYWKLELILTNPCWSDAMEELRFIEEGLSRSLPATLVLDGSCVRKVVFTTSREVCEDVCNEYKSDDDQTRGCVKKCKTEPDKTKSFVIAMPVERKGLIGHGKKVIDAVSKRSFYWLFDGKPQVFSFGCQLDGFELVKYKDACKEEGDSWVCEPKGDDVKRYKIKVVKETEKICKIVESVA